MHTTFSDILDKVEKLPTTQQETLIDIVRKRLIEDRRIEIGKNAGETLKAFRTGKANRGNVEDLKKALKK
ncbi:MAG: hypothetical protein Q8L88_05745 [Bacteroidota bacterium]|nr:hypothetical protein [Bacteroidota bacterium]